MLLPDFNNIYYSANCSKKELEIDLRQKYEIQYLGPIDDFEQTVINDCNILNELGTDYLEFGELAINLLKFIGIKTPADGKYKTIQLNNKDFNSAFIGSNHRFKDPFIRNKIENNQFEERILRTYTSRSLLIPEEYGTNLVFGKIIFRFQPYFIRNYGFFGGINSQIRIEPSEFLEYFNIKPDQIKYKLKEYKNYITNFQAKLKDSLSKTNE